MTRLASGRGAFEHPEAAALRQRLKTVLCVFRSLADHMGTHGDNAEDSRLELSGRIGALARVALASALDGIDLEELVRDELLRHAVGIHLASVEGCEVRLPPRSAELMSLAIHELATNSVKFGAFCRPDGRIRVTWHLMDDPVGSGRLRFEWQETGVPLGTPSRNAGFGLELVERLIAVLLKGEGKMVMLPGGVHCTIEIPLLQPLR